MKISQYLAGESKIIRTQFHKFQFRIDWEIVEKHASQINVTFLQS